MFVFLLIPLFLPLTLLVPLALSLPFIRLAASHKRNDAERAGRAVVNLIKLGIKPSMILTREAFENAIVVTIALQNTLDQDGNMNMNGRASGPDANAEFSGEITTSICGLPGTACAATGRRPVSTVRHTAAAKTKMTGTRHGDRMAGL